MSIPDTQICKVPLITLCHAKQNSSNMAGLLSFWLARLCLDLVLALEHIVNLLQVVSARDDGRGFALGGVIFLQMGLMTELAHLNTQNGQPAGQHKGQR